MCVVSGCSEQQVDDPDLHLYTSSEEVLYDNRCDSPDPA
jgi:hypothetical protein